MSAAPDILVTPEEYLAQERVADHKSELINGHVYAMPGASREHVRITTNLAVLLGQQESPSDYLIVPQDRMRVEHFTRRGPDQWLLAEVSGPSAAITIHSIGCSVSLADLYSRVEFPGAGVGRPLP